MAIMVSWPPADSRYRCICRGKVATHGGSEAVTDRSRALVGHLVIIDYLAMQFLLAGSRLNAMLESDSDHAADAIAETPVIAGWQVRQGMSGCADADSMRVIESLRADPWTRLKAVIPRRMAKVCFGFKKRSVLTQHEGQEGMMPRSCCLREKTAG